MINRRSIVLFIGVAASASAFCALNPQSYLDGNPQTKTDPQLYPVKIVAVDGNMQLATPIRVTPGPHWLEVAGPAARGSKAGVTKTQTVVLKIQPCTYYYLGAHKDSALVDQWKLVVDEEDTIQSCDPAQELKQFGPGKATPPPKSKTGS